MLQALTHYYHLLFYVTVFTSANIPICCQSVLSLVVDCLFIKGVDAASDEDGAAGLFTGRAGLSTVGHGLHVPQRLLLL